MTVSAVKQFQEIYEKSCDSKRLPVSETLLFAIKSIPQNSDDDSVAAEEKEVYFTSWKSKNRNSIKNKKNYKKKQENLRNNGPHSQSAKKSEDRLQKQHNQNQNQENKRKNYTSKDNPFEYENTREQEEKEAIEEEKEKRRDSDLKQQEKKEKPNLEGIPKKQNLSPQKQESNLQYKENSPKISLQLTVFNFDQISQDELELFTDALQWFGKTIKKKSFEKNIELSHVDISSSKYKPKVADSLRNNTKNSRIKDTRKSPLSILKFLQGVAGLFKKNSATLKSLEIEGIQFPKESAKHISKIIKSGTHTLKWVSFRGSDVDEKTIREICKSIGECTAISHLDISNCYFSDSIGVIIANIVKKNSMRGETEAWHRSLRENNSSLTSSSCDSNEYLTSANLSNNNFGYNTASALSRALTEDRMTRILDISHNHFDKRSIKQLLKMLRQNTGLKMCNLSHNVGIGEWIWEEEKRKKGTLYTYLNACFNSTGCIFIRSV